MKKTISMIIAASLTLLLLTGCANNSPKDEDFIPESDESAETVTEQEEQNESEDTSDILPTTDVDAQPSAAEEDSTSADEMFDAAFSMIDHPVAELYSLIGEPADKSYATSCIGGGQDGELYYDGFIVCTYVDGENETVVDVYK